LQAHQAIRSPSQQSEFLWRRSVLKVRDDAQLPQNLLAKYSSFERLHEIMQFHKKITAEFIMKMGYEARRYVYK